MSSDQTFPWTCTPVFMHPSNAIAVLANHKTDELCAEDDTLATFGGHDTGFIYKMGVNKPEEFVDAIKSLFGRYDDECAYGIRAWITLAYMNEWRTDASNVASKAFYKAWLCSELAEVDASETKDDTTTRSPKRARVENDTDKANNDNAV